MHRKKGLRNLCAVSISWVPRAVLNHLMLDAGDWTLKEQQVLSATEPPLQPHPILVFNNKSSHNFLATLFLKCSIACPLCYLLLISKNRNGLVHCCLNSDRVHGTRFLKCWDGMLAPRCLAGIKYIVSVLRGWCLSKPQQAVYKIYCQQKTAEASQRWLSSFILLLEGIVGGMLDK